MQIERGVHGGGESPGMPLVRCLVERVLVVATNSCMNIMKMENNACHLRLLNDGAVVVESSEESGETSRSGIETDPSYCCTARRDRFGRQSVHTIPTSQTFIVALYTFSCLLGDKAC